jgi:iron complex outermembrane receptor protein
LRLKTLIFRTKYFLLLGSLWAAAVAAQESAPQAGEGASSSAGASDSGLSQVVVTATRIAQSSFDLPVAIDRVSDRQIREGQLQVNLSESLDQVPGIAVQSRQNYAQDLQLSVRGFGARSSFGVRGVRLYSDGIPGTMPDGQGQFAQFDLSTADHIEVLRGPFSALYGNSSGGVIEIFTKEGQPGMEVQGTAEYGTFNTQRYALETSGASGPVNYVADVTHFQTDGYRDHSEAERNILNSKVGIALDDVSKLTVVLNAIQTPFVQDPLGLTRAQLEADPRQAGVNADLYNTRKSLNQEQLGLNYERRLTGNDDLAAEAYIGHRHTIQFQAIPMSTESAITNPGGVIDLGRAYEGADVHVTDHRDLAGRPLQVTAGMNYDYLDEDRRGFLNFVGDEVGVRGMLRRDEINHVFDFDQYVQAQWDPAPPWRLMAGVRNSTVNVDSLNNLPTAGPVAQTDAHYGATNPVAGVTYRASSLVNLYASYGKGFETPTLNDLAYRSTNGSLPGLNFALHPARSDNVEVGVKAETAQVRASADVFYIKTHNELAVEANTAGRSVEENISETRRRGAELALDAWWSGGFTARLAYTYINAEVESPYMTCVTTPCHPILIPEGNHLPAVPQNSLYAGITWRYAPAGFFVTAETFGRSKIYTDDRNSDYAAGYWVDNLRLGFEQDTAHWHLAESASIDNFTDRRYVGSVIVNETNTRFFEPAPGTTAFIILTAAYRDRRAGQ